MIVEFSDFKGEAMIPDLKPEIGTEDPINTATQNELQEFIDKYEWEYLLQFLGSEKAVSELYDYFNFPEEEKTDEEKNNLLKSLKTIIPNFIAFYWFRNETVKNTGIGAVIPQGQNSKRTNNFDRSVKIFNEMVVKSRELFVSYFNCRFPIKRYNKVTEEFEIVDIFNKITWWI